MPVEIKVKISRVYHNILNNIWPLIFRHSFLDDALILCYLWSNVHCLTSAGVVFRPGFIYGKRKVDGYEIPLDLIGEPLEKFLSAIENFTKPLNTLPASDVLLAPPVSVDDLAFAVVSAIRDDDFFGVFTIEQIKEAAAGVKV